MHLMAINEIQIQFALTPVHALVRP
jgi:hypothetical protein